MNAKEVFLQTRLREIQGTSTFYLIQATLNQINYHAEDKKYEVFLKTESYSSEEINFFFEYFEALGYNITLDSNNEVKYCKISWDFPEHKLKLVNKI